MPDPTDVSRRDFVKAVGSSAIVPSLGLLLAGAETPVAMLYRALTREQTRDLCFPGDHPLRGVFQNNWKVVKPTIGDMSREQQHLCREIFHGLCSDEGAGRFDRLMDQDYGGFARYHAAIFGEPGSAGPFEWVLTGRHVTLRADGHRASGLAIGSPIFYGHSAEGPENVWHDQTRRAHAVLDSLDPAQKSSALVTRTQADAERAARLRGDKDAVTGLDLTSLDDERRPIVQEFLKGLVSLFRDFDPTAGPGPLRLSVYEQSEVDRGGMHAAWKLEGPDFAWRLHGHPHVHAWVETAATRPQAGT